MTSYTNVPLSSNVVANDVTPMNANTNYIATTLGKDHQIAIGGSTGNAFEGRHKQVSLNDRSNNNLAMPGDGTDSLVWSSGGNVYFKNTTISAGYQLTAGNSLPVAGATGMTVLPGGMIMKWGTTGSSNANIAVTFATAFPNNIYNIQVTALRASGTFTTDFSVATGATTAGFTIVNANSSSTSLAYYWLAIGN